MCGLVRFEVALVERTLREYPFVDSVCPCLGVAEIAFVPMQDAMQPLSAQKD